MSYTDELQKNRWYDQSMLTSRAVDLLETFPPAIQSIVARGISMLADKEFRVNEMMKSYRSLGRDKVLSLYKSKRRLRSMDEDASVHKALNHLSILSQEGQEFMAARILELMSLIAQYLKACKSYSQDPNEDEIMAMTQTYVAEGSKEALAFLVTLENTFLKKVNKLGNAVMKERERTKDIKVDSDKMKIRDSDMRP